MEAFLVEMSQITCLLEGQSSEAGGILEKIRADSPSSWELDWESDKFSTGQALESLLSTGKSKGRPHLAGRALQLICRALGEPLNTESLNDANFMLVADTLEGIAMDEYFYGRVPPPLQEWGGNFPVVGYLTPQEVEKVLCTWPEPDHDDPAPEVYAAREQIEEWLIKSRDSKKTLIMFWE